MIKVSWFSLALKNQLSGAFYPFLTELDLQKIIFDSLVAFIGNFKATALTFIRPIAR